MSSVGSYLSTAGRNQAARDDLDWLCSGILKALGEQGRSLTGLISWTHAHEEQVRRALAILQDDRLVAGDDREYFLTDLGRKALFVVA